jgi:hypothetical protein
MPVIPATWVLEIGGGAKRAVGVAQEVGPWGLEFKPQGALHSLEKSEFTWWCQVHEAPLCIFSDVSFVR